MYKQKRALCKYNRVNNSTNYYYYYYTHPKKYIILIVHYFLYSNLFKLYNLLKKNADVQQNN